MTRPQPPELPEHKPIEEMTREERIEYAKELGRITRRELAELNRPRRERKLPAGPGQAANQKEWAIFRAGLADWRKDEPGPGQPKDG